MARHHATCAIVSVGDELVLGQTQDTNARWLADRLASLGVVPVEIVAVGDDARAHAAALERLSAVADLIVCTGGLGPTADDLTREALAAAGGDTLVEDPIALAQIESWFGARGREMPDLNRAQARRPSRGASLANLIGTAPGVSATIGEAPGRRCDVFCLPGPPAEMAPMFEAQVVPRLVPPHDRCVRTRVLHCAGLGESAIATRLGDMMSRSRVPLIGTTASGGVVSVRLRYTGPLAGEEADEALERDARRIRALVGPHVFGEGATTLPQAVVESMRARASSLAVAESCTGGRLAGRLTDVPGSSQVFRGGWVCYSEARKRDDLGVAPAILGPRGPGVYSRECAAAMAEGALRRADATHALSTTGIAGPEGGRPDQPVGTVYVGLAWKEPGAVRSVAREFRFVGEREGVRSWAVVSALSLLWMTLAGASETRLLFEAAPR